MHVPPTLPPPTISLTPHSRAASMDVAAINKDERTAPIVFATESPVLRWDWDIGDYYEVLSCTPGAADLSRLNSGGAFLREHDRSQQIGVHISATMDADKKGRALVKFSRSTLGEQEFQDVQDGIRSNISVSYQPLSMVLQRTGSDTEPPTYLVDRWQALENSLVSVPADVNCRVGRAAAEAATPPPADAPRCKVTVPDNLRTQHEQVMIRRNRSLRFHAPDDGSNPGGAAPAALSAEDRAKIVKEGQDAERKRCNDIEGFVTFFSRGGVNIRKLADEYKASGKSAEDLRAHVMSEAFKPEPIDLTVVNGEVPAGARSANAGAEHQALTIGQRFVGKKAFQDFARGWSRDMKYVDQLPRGFIGRRGKAHDYAEQNRAGFNSPDLAAVNITTSQSLIALGVQRLTIMDLIAGGTMDSEGFLYPIENSFNPNQAIAGVASGIAQNVPERGLKPEWEPDLGTARADAQVVAVMMSVPKQFMQDFAAFGSYMDQRGQYLVDIQTENQILYGDGLGANLKGILNTAGIQTRDVSTAGGNMVDTSAKSITDIQVYGQFEPDGFAFHPFDWEVIRLLKDANGQYLAGGPFYAPYGNGQLVKFYTLWGLPVAVTTAVKVGRPIAGAWKLAAQYFIRQGMQIEMTNSHKDYFQRNMLAILFEHRLALAVYRPVCFVEMTGFTGAART